MEDIWFGISTQEFKLCKKCEFEFPKSFYPPEIKQMYKITFYSDPEYKECVAVVHDNKITLYEVGDFGLSEYAADKLREKFGFERKKEIYGFYDNSHMTILKGDEGTVHFTFKIGEWNEMFTFEPDYLACFPQDTIDQISTPD